MGGSQFCKCNFDLNNFLEVDLENVANIQKNVENTKSASNLYKVHSQDNSQNVKFDSYNKIFNINNTQNNSKFSNKKIFVSGIQTNNVTRIYDIKNNEIVKKDEDSVDKYNGNEVNKSNFKEINVKRDTNFIKNEKFKENDEDFDAKIDLKRSMEIKIECNNEKNIMKMNKSHIKIQNMTNMSESSDFYEKSKNHNFSIKQIDDKSSNNKRISNIKISKIEIQDQNGRNKNEYDNNEDKGMSQKQKLSSLRSQISINSKNLILKNENERLYLKNKEKLEKSNNFDIPLDKNNESNKSSDYDSEYPNNENPIPNKIFENIKANNESYENLKNDLKFENENKNQPINNQIVDKVILKNVSRNKINQDGDQSLNRNRSSLQNETWRKIKISTFIPDEKLIDVDESIDNSNIDDLIYHSELYNVTFPEVNKYQKPFSLKFCALTKNNFR